MKGPRYVVTITPARARRDGLVCTPASPVPNPGQSVTLNLTTLAMVTVRLLQLSAQTTKHAPRVLILGADAHVPQVIGHWLRSATLARVEVAPFHPALTNSTRAYLTPLRVRLRPTRQGAALVEPGRTPAPGQPLVLDLGELEATTPRLLALAQRLSAQTNVIGVTGGTAMVRDVVSYVLRENSGAQVRDLDKHRALDRD